MSEIELKQIPLSALFIALGVTIPQLFHMIGLGPIFLPMFLPIYMAAVFLTWKYTLVVTILTPVISFLITGMPPIVPPILILMLCELSIAALLISILYVHMKKNIYLALIIGIFVGRFVDYALMQLVLPYFGYDTFAVPLFLVAKGFPGVILQFLVIPVSIKIIGKKYPKMIIRDK